MRSFTVKTFSANTETRTQDWFVIDAGGKVLGRLASQIAHRLRGKHKPIYTPHVDTGDFIIVINADKVKLTGNKLQNKHYFSYSGYPGGLKSKTAEELLKAKPAELIVQAVKGMLPKNRLGRQMIKKLKVYRGETHPHQAQQPKLLDVKGV